MANALQTADLPKIIKRLELIKTLISLEEDKEIEGHVFKLRQFSLNSELENIVALLEEKSYSKTMPAIDAFLNQHHQVTKYADPEIEGLKLEAKLLEAQLNALSEERADLEKLVHEFGVRHNHELGELLKKILHYRKEKAKGTPQQEEAEKDYNDYSSEYEKSKEENIIELSEDEKKELKNKYRKASKLCHPDVVSEDQKELADKLFAELNAAYERNDLKRVSEILENLENGNFFVNKSDAISEKQLMRVEIEKLRLRIKELKENLLAIKESDAYKTIISIHNWDDYFTQTKEKLSQELKALQNEISHGK